MLQLIEAAFLPVAAFLILLVCAACCWVLYQLGLGITASVGQLAAFAPTPTPAPAPVPRRSVDELVDLIAEQLEDSGLRSAYVEDGGLTIQVRRQVGARWYLSVDGRHSIHTSVIEMLLALRMTLFELRGGR